MSARLHTSRHGLDLIRSFEGFTPASVRLADGRWMIGYGHVRSAREGVRITESDAEDLLRFDLKPVEEALSALVFAPLNQNQFDALASLVFNISPGQFRESDLLRRLNAGDVLGAAAGFDAWRKARIGGRLIVVDALVRRRAAEKALFLEATEARPSAPTPIVTPELDPAFGGSGHPFSPQDVSRIAPAASRAPEAEEDVGAITAALDRFAREPKPTPVRPGPASASQPAAPVRPASAPMPAPAVEAAPVAPAYPSQPSPPSDERREASRIVAARIARILERVEQPVPSSPSRPAGSSAPLPSDRRTGKAGEPSSPAREIPEDLPDFDAPSVPHEPGSGRRLFIDDTDVFALRPQPAPKRNPIAQGAQASASPGGASLAFVAFILLGLALSAAGLAALSPEAAADNPGAPLAARPVIAAGAVMWIAGIYCLAVRRTRSRSESGPGREG
jgi:GH24 family phage-related lysozyme (muramidase)